MSKKVPGFVHEFIDEVLVNEGGYQDSKKDTGNIVKNNGTVVGTNLGITPYTLADYRNVSADSITVEDMKSLTEEEAREIYLKEYYIRPKLDLIPDLKLRENVFDMGVNSGPGAAIKILQRLAGAKDDGFLGPNTVKKIEEAGIDTNDYVDGRIEFYNNLVEENPVKEEWLDGWINRAEKYRTGYKLSDYAIRRGDTLFTIANNLGVDVEDLRHFNDSIRNTDTIYPEQVIRVPDQRGARDLDVGSLDDFNNISTEKQYATLDDLPNDFSLGA